MCERRPRQGQADDAPDLVSGTARVVINGGGAVTVQASEGLDAEVSGSGSVPYVDNPRFTQRIIGSGIMGPR